MVVLVVLVVLVVTNSPPTPLQHIPDSPHSATPKRKNPKQPSKQSKILSAGSNIFPLLKKMSSAIGHFIHVPGSYWEGCPAADKEKIFKCLVVEFVTQHDFGFYKSSGFKVRACVALGSRPVVALPNVFASVAVVPPSSLLLPTHLLIFVVPDLARFRR